MADQLKICFAASSGGHYEQLMMLKPLMKKYSGFVLTEKTLYNAEIEGERSEKVKNSIDHADSCHYLSCVDDSIPIRKGYPRCI